MRASVRWLTAMMVYIQAIIGTSAFAGDNYAILVGVADYDEKELRPLKFTRADVLDFHAALLESGFASKNVVLMHDDVAKLATHYEKLGKDFKPKDYIPTGANIRKEVELMLGRLRADDSVIVALAGHGVQFKGDKKSYFCPSDAALNRKDSLIAFEEIFAALKDSSASRKLFLVDACQNDPQSEISRSRATIDLDSVTRPQTETVPEGIIALFSCKAGQKAFEHPPLAHGVFFYHLLDGWKGSGDLNGDGQLSYQELATYTEKKTAEYAAVKLKVLQTPVLRNEFSGGEWVLRNLKATSTSRKSPPISVPPRGGPLTVGSKAGQEWDSNGLRMKFCWCPAGTFTKGSPGSEYQRDGSEEQAIVTMTGFWLGKFEVTQAEWSAIMGSTLKQQTSKPGYNRYLAGEGPDYPMYCVSYDEAKEFAQKLTTAEQEAGRLPTNSRYRLPTDDEWEYGCRSGTTTASAFGANFDSRVANFNGNHPYKSSKFGRDLPNGPSLDATCEVGQYRANSWGLHDMHGNVREWILASSESTPTRVARGGSWDCAGSFCRSACKTDFKRDRRSNDTGFRLVIGRAGK